MQKRLVQYFLPCIL